MPYYTKIQLLNITTKNEQKYDEQTISVSNKRIRKRPTEITKHYKDKDIFNTDNTGLFPNWLSTVHVSSDVESGKGGKQSKPKYTALVCEYMQYFKYVFTFRMAFSLKTLLHKLRQLNKRKLQAFLNHKISIPIQCIEAVHVHIGKYIRESSLFYNLSVVF